MCIPTVYVYLLLINRADATVRSRQGSADEAHYADPILLGKISVVLHGLQ